MASSHYRWSRRGPASAGRTPGPCAASRRPRSCRGRSMTAETSRSPLQGSPSMSTARARYGVPARHPEPSTPVIGKLSHARNRVHVRQRRNNHRNPLLQGGRKHGNARRGAVHLERHSACLGDFHERERLRLAADDLLLGGARQSEHHATSLRTTPPAGITRTTSTTSSRCRRLAETCSTVPRSTPSRPRSMSATASTPTRARSPSHLRRARRQTIGSTLSSCRTPESPVPPPR